MQPEPRGSGDFAANRHRPQQEIFRMNNGMVLTESTINANVVWNNDGEDVEGVVAAIVKAGELPNLRRFPELLKKAGDEGPRPRDSVVIVANGQAHWPDVDDVLPKNVPSNVVAENAQPSGGAIEPGRPPSMPGKYPQASMLKASPSPLDAEFFPVVPHFTEPYGPIFTGHIQGRKVVANVVPADDKGPIRLEFVGKNSGDTIAQGLLDITKNGNVAIALVFGNGSDKNKGKGKAFRMMATYAAAEMLPRALGVHHVVKAPKRQHLIAETKLAEKILQETKDAQAARSAKARKAIQTATSRVRP